MATSKDSLQWTRQEALTLVRTTGFGQRHVCTHCGVFMTIAYDGSDNGGGETWPILGTLDDGCYGLEHLMACVTYVKHICVRYKQVWWSLPDDGLKRVAKAS
eukprot:NODE_22982_length_686_cov_1.488372.p3 GENE.NODE_22982_length_686_cov_1.488372~~NODE_22982_length_686_cov_1.488372.p3  ORF type:complete len:102 (-),score=31.87 NODE_22982_length_686_cov_1.488372:43-348(-)